MKITDNKPMMNDKEIEIIDSLLKELKPKRCLEWGSGNSTVYFPRHKSIKLWLAVEHNGHYLDYLKDKCLSNVQTLWVLPGTSYPDIVQRSNQTFDFILIDGLDREKCLENALNIISDNGIILLHDSGRKEYQELIKKYNGEKLSDGEEPAGNYYKHRGLALFRKQNAKV